MPLITVWKSSPAAVQEFSIEQVVSTAGDGNLKDGSLCAQELREYLSEIPSKKIAEYVDHCLENSFNKSGHVLQDLINEIGRRLDYKVTNGLYQGSANKIGFDGIWTSPEGHSIVIEVKTTDVYRIALQTISNYREKLFAQNQLSGSTSILIVVGRDDTGELEAQIRGSRYAWDIRLQCRRIDEASALEGKFRGHRNRTKNKKRSYSNGVHSARPNGRRHVYNRSGHGICGRRNFIRYRRAQHCADRKH